MKTIFIAAIAFFAALSAGAQLTIDGRDPNIQEATVTNMWGEEMPLRIKGKRTKRFSIDFVGESQSYKLCFTCRDGSMHTITVAHYLPRGLDVREWVYVEPCADGHPDSSVVYFSFDDEEYLHRPKISTRDWATFRFYRIDPYEYVLKP